MKLSTNEKRTSSRTFYITIPFHYLPRTQRPILTHLPTTHPLSKNGPLSHAGPETSYITKLFKHTNHKIAYRTSNNIQSFLSQNIRAKDIFTQSGAYELTCRDCGKTYVGQTGRDFRTLFNEYKHSFIHNSQSSKYAQHLLEHSLWLLHGPVCVRTASAATGVFGARAQL
jgi:hypothetical protein